LDLFEHEARDLFARHGVPVPPGEVTSTAAGAHAAAVDIGGPVVVKAQVKVGGRGKAGGVKLARTPTEARAAAEAILGMDIKGHTVHKVLVTAASTIADEYYFSFLLDRANRTWLAMASAEGGMDIEEVAAKEPEKILREYIDRGTGIIPFQSRKLAFGMGLPGAAANKLVKVMDSIYKAFIETDASMIEINPLILTKGGDLLALDAKVSFDDNALYRHPDLRDFRDVTEEDPLEVEASKFSLNYIRLDGNIGCMVNGAGLAMATMDIIKLAGGEPANFLDVGGGANAEQIRNAFKILMSDKNVKAVLINIFGGILRCDVLAQGVIAAVKELGVPVPIVIRMEGTNVEEGKRLLRESGMKLTTADSMDEAAKKVVELAG